MECSMAFATPVTSNVEKKVPVRIVDYIAQYLPLFVDQLIFCADIEPHNETSAKEESRDNSFLARQFGSLNSPSARVQPPWQNRNLSISNDRPFRLYKVDSQV